MPRDRVGLTSTGHQLAEESYLDARFQAARGEYEDMVRWAGIRASSAVLDAGSGSGAYLPTLCELAGPSGSVTALDLAPENVEACRIRLKTLKPQCHAEAVLGSIQELPFSESSFGALWCANTLQYLSNEELSLTLTEFKRVTRSGGIVAIKDGDITCFQLAGIEPTTMWRYLDSARHASQQIAGLMRAIDIPRSLRKTGFVNIRAKTFIIERRAPLDSTNRVALSSLIEFIVHSALDTKPQKTDYEQWHLIDQRLREGKLYDTPDFFIREGAMVVIGEVTG